MNREQQICRVTLVGSLGNLLLVVFKFAAGILGRSSAMVADAVHSLSDFLTDIVVMVFVGISAKPQDASHDYGHGKYETLATLFIGIALVGAAVGIIASGLMKILAALHGEPLAVPGQLALWAALLSILVKEILYRYTAARARSLDSPAMLANAWHHRSDSLSSIGAALGIGGAILLGEKGALLDPLASIVVGAMLVKVSWDLLNGCFSELTDHSLSDETEQEIEAIIRDTPGVSEPHNLRTRRIGNRIAIEAHIRMDGDTPLRQAHEQASSIERRLRERFGPNTLVTLWRHTPPPGPRAGLVHRASPARTLRPEYPRHPPHGAGEKLKYSPAGRCRLCRINDLADSEPLTLHKLKAHSYALDTQTYPVITDSTNRWGQMG